LINTLTVAIQGDFGKPRPVLVIQANHFGEHTSVTVLPITSALVAAPLLRVTVLRETVGPAFGRIDQDALVEVERCLAVFLGIAK
jgi:mRNA interferase MazF